MLVTAGYRTEPLDLVCYRNLSQGPKNHKDGKLNKKYLDLSWRTSSRPVLVVTTRMSELLSSSVTVSSSSVGVADLNWNGVLAPRMSPACVT